MIRTLIIDAAPAVKKHLQKLISKYSEFIIVGSCSSIAEAKILIPATQPDLLLLDVELNDGSSFDLLKSFGKYNFQIVFITANNYCAIKAIKCGAMDYLIKPINENEFSETLKKVAAKLISPSLSPYSAGDDSHLNSGNIMRKRIVLRLQQYLLVVAFDEIIYCHSNAGYTTFYLTGNRKELVSNPIKAYEQLLPVAAFMRPHQSYLVNNNFIDRYNKEGYLILKTGVSIPVSTRKKDYVVKLLLEG